MKVRAAVFSAVSVALALPGCDRLAAREQAVASEERSDSSRASAPSPASGPRGREACEQLRDWYLERGGGFLSLPKAKEAYQRSFLTVCMNDESTTRCAERALAGLSDSSDELAIDDRCGLVLMLAQQRVLAGQQRPELLEPPRKPAPPTSTPEERRACARLREWLRARLREDAPADGGADVYERGLDEQFVNVCLSSPSVRWCAMEAAPTLAQDEPEGVPARCATALDEAVWKAQLLSIHNPPM